MVAWAGRLADLLRYVASYVAKYGESLLSNGLDLRTWKAGAPEQVMALAREAMSFTNLATVEYVPPAPRS